MNVIAKILQMPFSQPFSIWKYLKICFKLDPNLLFNVQMDHIWMRNFGLLVFKHDWKFYFDGQHFVKVSGSLS